LVASLATTFLYNNGEKGVEEAENSDVLEETERNILPARRTE
jgi:hypothetical protein